jgi:hypothetical protein
MDDSRCEHDEPYTLGRRPETYLAPREIVRLTILRSRLGACADLKSVGVKHALDDVGIRRAGKRQR